MRRRITSRDVVLGLRMLPWALALPVLKYVLPLPVLVRMMARIRPRPRAGDEDRILGLAAAFGRLRPRSEGNCLERSLLTYRFLLGAGAAPELVLGVNKTDQVSGHAWVTLNGAPVGHAQDGGFDPIVVFGPGGGPTSPSWSLPKRHSA